MSVSKMFNGVTILVPERRDTAWGTYATAMLETVIDGAVAKDQIVNDLTTGGATDVLSAEQGKTLKTQVDTKLDALQVQNIQTNSYTLVLGDANKLVILASGSAMNLTVPTNASVPFPIGTRIDVLQGNSGTITFTGVSIYSADSNLKTRATYSAATLIKVSTDGWYLVGDLKA